jgi:hypothetical protein
MELQGGLENEISNLQYQINSMVIAMPSSTTTVDAKNKLKDIYKDQDKKKFGEEIEIRLYEGKSDVSTSKSKDPFQCFILMGIEPKTKKVRYLKAITNVNTKMASSGLVGLGANILKSMNVPIDPNFQRSLKAAENNFNLISYDLMPTTDAQENIFQEQIKNFNTNNSDPVKPYMSHKVSKKYFSSKWDFTFEQGVEVTSLGGLRYSLTSLQTTLDSQNRAVDVKVKAGVGFGLGAEISCSDLKEIELKSDAKPELSEVKDLLDLIKKVNNPMIEIKPPNDNIFDNPLKNNEFKENPEILTPNDGSSNNLEK